MNFELRCKKKRYFYLLILFLLLLTNIITLRFWELGTDCNLPKEICSLPSLIKKIYQSGQVRIKSPEDYTNSELGFKKRGSENLKITWLPNWDRDNPYMHNPSHAWRPDRFSDDWKIKLSLFEWFSNLFSKKSGYEVIGYGKSIFDLIFPYRIGLAGARPTPYDEQSSNPSQIEFIGKEITQEVNLSKRDIVRMPHFVEFKKGVKVKVNLFHPDKHPQKLRLTLPFNIKIEKEVHEVTYLNNILRKENKNTHPFGFQYNQIYNSFFYCFIEPCRHFYHQKNKDHLSKWDMYNKLNAPSNTITPPTFPDEWANKPKPDTISIVSPDDSVQYQIFKHFYMSFKKHVPAFPHEDPTEENAPRLSTFHLVLDFVSYTEVTSGLLEDYNRKGKDGWPWGISGFAPFYRIISLQKVSNETSTEHNQFTYARNGEFDLRNLNNLLPEYWEYQRKRIDDWSDLPK